MDWDLTACWLVSGHGVASDETEPETKDVR